MKYIINEKLKNSLTGLISLIQKHSKKDKLMLSNGKIINVPFLNEMKKDLNDLEMIGMIEPIKAPYRINLMDECMIYKDSLDDRDEWSAQEQLEALEFYTYFDGYGIIATGREGSYQGNYYAIIEHKDFIFLWRDWFGSCNLCDGLEGGDADDGYIYIKQTLSEGNTLQFWSLEQAKAYVKEIKNDRFNYWQDFPLKLFDEAKDVIW